MMELTRTNPPEGRRGVKTWEPVGACVFLSLCKEAPAGTRLRLPVTAIITASRASNLHRLWFIKIPADGEAFRRMEGEII